MQHHEEALNYRPFPALKEHWVFSFFFFAGEDRWLCTLLLQQGYKVEYVAASDALTYAPEGFYEFYNQRRRWSPSTMANILDLLSDWKNVTSKNEDISKLYIAYQMFLMASSILTPGTILLMILGSLYTAFPLIAPWTAFVANLIPVIIMVILCFVASSDTQVRYNQDWLVFNANFSNYFSYSVAWHSQENDDGERIHMLWKYLYSLAHIFVVLRNALILRFLNSWFQTLQTTINRKFVFRWNFYFRDLRENHKNQQKLEPYN